MKGYVNNPDDRIYYVYAWYRKSTGEIFHIGKGKNDRYKETKQHRNQYFINTINAYKDDVDVRILKDQLTNEEACNLERQLIAKYKAIGQCKTNLHEGGCGGYTGKYDDPIRNEKISAKAIGRYAGEKNPMYGKTHTKEVRAKISAANKGKILSPEHIEKLRKANTGRKKTPEEIEKLRQANLGHIMSQESKDKMMKNLCPYEYQIYLNGELQFSCLGHTKLYEYCKSNYDISPTIIWKIVKNEWKPTFNKHKWLASLEIKKIPQK